MFTHILGVWICNHSDISQLKSFAMTILNGVSFWYSPKYCVLKSFFGSLIFSHFYSFPITISNLSSFWCFITPLWSFRIIALLTQTCATLIRTNHFARFKFYSYCLYQKLAFFVILIFAQTCATYSNLQLTWLVFTFTHISWFKGLHHSKFWYSLEYERPTPQNQLLGPTSRLLIIIQARLLAHREHSDIRAKYVR